MMVSFKSFERTMGIVRTSMSDGRLVTGSTPWYSCKCVVRSSCGFDLILSQKKKGSFFYNVLPNKFKSPSPIVLSTIDNDTLIPMTFCFINHLSFLYKAEIHN